MGITAKELPNDINELKALVLDLSGQEEKQNLHIDELEQERERLEKLTEVLTDELALVRQKLFGRSSEKLTEEDILQGVLFAETSESNEKVDSEGETIEVAGHRRKRAGRQPLPESFPRVEILHDIPEEQKVCGCGAKPVRIGEESSEKLDIIPQKIQVLRHIRPKYACKECEGSGDEDRPAVRIAEPPAQILPKSIASAGLLAYIITSKFVAGVERRTAVLPTDKAVCTNRYRYSPIDDV